MSKVLIVCRSITHAQKIENFIKKQGYFASINRSPREISLKKCSYVVILSKRDFDEIQSLLKSVDIGKVSLFLYENKIYKEFGGEI